jgi:hypothetical protein
LRFNGKDSKNQRRNKNLLQNTINVLQK